MANDGDDGNDVDPLLLQYLISPRPPPLISSPEHNDVTISIAMKPSDFRNRLLFGSQGESSLSQNPSPSSSATTSFSGPAITNPIDHKTEQSDSKSIVTKAVALLILYLSFGVLIYWWNRDSYAVVHTHPIVDGLYFSIVTMCTIGYGDITPNSVVTKLFSILFVFVVMCMFLSGYVINLQENYYLI